MSHAILEEVFDHPNPVIGVIHLHALPGSPGWAGDVDDVIDAALSDARALKKGGVHGVVVENYGDAPFLPGAVGPECTSTMAVALRAVIEETGLPAGVNVLRNDPVAALAVAVAGGGRFIRTNVHTGAMLTDQGLLEGQAHATLRSRAAWGAEHVAVFADVLVKHAATLVPREPRRAARDAVERGLADGLLATGAATGSRADLREVAAIRDEMPGVPLLVASGVRAEDMALLASLADGVIVGTALKRKGATSAPVDPRRVKRIIAAARKAWS